MYGLLEGLAEGLREGLRSYKEEREYQTKKKQQGLLNEMTMKDRGLVQDESGDLVYAPEREAKTKAEMAQNNYNIGLSEAGHPISKNYVLKQKNLLSSLGYADAAKELDENSMSGLDAKNYMENFKDVQKIKSQDEYRDTLARLAGEKIKVSREGLGIKRENLEKEKPANAEERRNVGFYKMATSVQPELAKSPNLSLLDWGAVKKSGGLAGSDEAKLFYTRAKRFLNAIARKESGAAIADHEWDNYERMYIPLPGDPPSVIEDKAKARQEAIEGLQISSGRAIDELGKVEQSKPSGFVKTFGSYPPEVQQAIIWLKQNPKSPDAEAVRKKIKEYGADENAL